MSVVYESQCHATCDNCGKIDMTSTMRLADFKKKLRQEVTDAALIQDVLSSPRKYICF